jgi:glycosyltransferase involved in cell wall biosynthesis
MLVRVFIVCYNEELLLPLTVAHYRKMFKNVEIYIIDNQSTDNSVKIAKELNCNVINLDTDNQYKEEVLAYTRNNIWKSYLDGWIIVCDMDELILVTDNDLLEEESKGTTILSIKGMQMVANSDSDILDDIDIVNINKGFHYIAYDKNLVFHRNSILNMNWNNGSHCTKPVGNIKFSEKVYFLNHYARLGLKWIYNRYQLKFIRSERARKADPYYFSVCYGISLEQHKKEFQEDLDASHECLSLQDFYDSLNYS